MLAAHCQQFRGMFFEVSERYGGEVPRRDRGKIVFGGVEPDVFTRFYRILSAPIIEHEIKHESWDLGTILSLLILSTTAVILAHHSLQFLCLSPLQITFRA